MREKEGAKNVSGVICVRKRRYPHCRNSTSELVLRTGSMPVVCRDIQVEKGYLTADIKKSTNVILCFSL